MTLLEQLRSQTHALHQQVDSNSALTQLTQADLTVGQYAQILNKLYQPQRSLEKVLLPALDLFVPNYDLQARYHLIERDLVELGYPVQKVENIKLNINSQSEAIGILYVLEGSKLGGRFILSNLKKVLPEQSHHFFSSSDLSAKSFRERLTQASSGLSEADYERAVFSAQNAFECFLDLGAIDV